MTSATHDECVKLIKKSGETLALKILTVNYSKYKNFDSQSISSSTNSNIENISPTQQKNKTPNSPPSVYYVEGTKSTHLKQKRTK